MIVNYRFVNGETAEVEVAEEIGSMIMESRRKEEAAEKYAHRHCLSIDALQYEGLDYAVYDAPFEKEEAAEEEKRAAKLSEAYNSLSPEQKRRLKLYAEGKTLREIAEIEGVSFIAVSKSIERAASRLKIYFRRGG